MATASFALGMPVEFYASTWLDLNGTSTSLKAIFEGLDISATNNSQCGKTATATSVVTLRSVALRRLPQNEGGSDALLDP